MRHSLYSLLIVMLAPFVAAAQDPLPDEVAELYVAYQQAEQSGDLGATLEAADAVYRVARRARVDDVTLGALAENLGYYASASQDFERAYDAWREAAERAERSEGEGAVSGYRWQNAAVAAYQLEDFGDARRCAVNASNGFHAITDTSPDVIAMSADAHLLAAQLSGSQGEFVAAGRSADRALAVFSETSRSPDRYYALAFFHSGIRDFFRRRYFDAAVKLHLAADIFQASVPDSDEAVQAATLARLARREVLDVDLGDGLSERREEEARETMERILTEVNRFAFHAEILGTLDGVGTETVLPEGAEPFRSVLRMEPRYPGRAAERGLEALVILQFSIDETGRVVDAEVTALFGDQSFADASLAALEGWVYDPATIDGEPIRVDGIETQFNFELAD